MADKTNADGLRLFPNRFLQPVSEGEKKVDKYVGIKENGKVNK